MLKLSRPLYITLAALTYVFGVSIAKYLGKPFRADAFWLGLVGIMLAQVSMNLLAEVYRPENERILENETPSARRILRNNALYISIASLTAMAFIAYVLFINGSLHLSSFIFLFLSIIIILAYSIPPLRLLNRGFGEFLLAAHIAYVIPSIGFLFQAGENHRMLGALATPLTALAFAYFLILNFPTFAADQKYQRGTLLRIIGWERAAPLHHSLIIAAYIIFFASSFIGLSLKLLWPAFITFPFAIFQIFLLRNIALGGRPNWPLLTATALAVFGLTTYFLTLTFWLR